VTDFHSAKQKSEVVTMPRKENYERELWTDNWKTFGLFLRTQRIVKGFTQEQAAQAAKVSTRQWIRYEQGSRVLSKRYPMIAKALNVPLARMLSLAGYKVAPRRNDVNVRLRRVHDMLRIGRLDLALKYFLLLYYQIGPFDAGPGYHPHRLTAPNFATAVISLESLPKWLFEVLAKCMQEILSEHDQKQPTSSLRRVVLRECIDEMQRRH
jgi:transcriptional regulator with XRE-family HTH domain